MPPFLALGLWIVLVVALFRFDPARRARTSWALWLPVLHFFIAGSRLPSLWLGGSGSLAAQALEEGNTLDRTIASALILLAIGVLASRSYNWSSAARRNLALIALLVFGLVSVAWSDFPFVAFKRWIRDLTGYLVVLVMLTDEDPLEAFRTVLRRVSFLLIPLSIVLIKYFPAIGRSYDPWSGRPFYAGATTSKNMLGVLCLLAGLFFFWDMLTRWSQRAERGTKGILLLNGAFLAMTLWLLNLADSATSRLCLAFGCALIAAAHTRAVQKHPTVMKAALPAALAAFMALTFGLGVDITAEIARLAGRDPTLTDRTYIWDTLLRIGTNPLIGTGYESFWLGSRLQAVWRAGYGAINEAHNGYLQVYLNLGLVGVGLVVVFLSVSYAAICRRFHSALGKLALPLWAVLVVYNFTEAAFLGGLLWMTLLPAALVWDRDEPQEVAQAADSQRPARQRRRSPREAAYTTVYSYTPHVSRRRIPIPRRDDQF